MSGEATDVNCKNRTPMTAVTDRMDSILRLQPFYGILLTGFYLTEVELDEVRATLTPDFPDTGAIGRYLCVPVYSFRDNPDFEVEEPQFREGLLYARIPYVF